MQINSSDDQENNQNSKKISLVKITQNLRPL